MMIDGAFSYLAFLLVGLFIATWSLRRSSSARRRLPLPPGPRPLPIIGNLLDVPTRDLGRSFYDLNKNHGDIVYLNVCGQPMIVLGTFEAAVDLLEKRSGNYSDRRFSCMADLTGWTWLFATTSYGPLWRRTRRAFHEYMHPNAVAQYRTIQEFETSRYLRRVIDNPLDLYHHGRHLFGALIISVGYGIDVDNTGVDHLAIAEEAMGTFSSTFLPGKYLVETFPILRFLPSFMPGAQFKRDAAAWYPIVRKMRDAPWEAAMALLREGRGTPSMASGLVERMAHPEGETAADEEEISKDAVASAYAGGADTTFSVLQNFYIAMASYPEVQTRAQAELDAVVGPNRLPTLDDKDDLPYVSALVKECLRWRPVGQLGMVHVSAEEDEYQGYRIPKGSSVVVNIWAYTHNPTMYPNPEAFEPDRFLKDRKLNPSVQVPSAIVFGFGRRVCPGRHFAETSIFTVISAILHTFSITSPVDEHGEPIRLVEKVNIIEGVISCPEPFKCNITVRSPGVETLMHTRYDDRTST